MTVELQEILPSILYIQMKYLRYLSSEDNSRTAINASIHTYKHQMNGLGYFYSEDNSRFATNVPTGCPNEKFKVLLF
jgi:hypothetical protein